MPLTTNRLDNILQRLLTFQGVAGGSQFPREGLDGTDIEQRKAMRQRLDILKSSLITCLTRMEGAPAESDVTQQALLEGVDHGNAAAASVNQAIQLISFVRNPPAGFTLTSAQRIGLEARLLQFRDAAIAELNLI